MQPEVKKYLYDSLTACEAVLGFVREKDLDDYTRDLMLRSAVERQLMIIGEALNQAVRLDEKIGQRIPDTRDIIALRNIIAHGYAIVEDATVWGIVEADVPVLHEQVRELLAEP
jgi:uncharacterized protein with HEPN domain